MKATLLPILGLGLLVCGGCPLGPPLVDGNPRVRVTTTMGEFVIELDQANAPIAVQNFLQYVQAGFYDGTIIHRAIPGFVVQGGGYLPGMEPKAAGSPIQNEANNGLRNLRGTIAMAHLPDDPNSATSQFYINLADNASLDATLDLPGYAVFGQVVSGMDVVDQIGARPTENRGDFSNVPVTDVVIDRATVEAGEQILNVTWDAYLQEYLFNILTGLREALVGIMGAFIGGA